VLKTSKLMTGKPYTRHSGSASKCDGDDSGMGRSCTQLGQERFKNNLLVFSTAPNLRLGDGEYLDLEARAARVQFWTEEAIYAPLRLRLQVRR
jgi:hypothetical protein